MAWPDGAPWAIDIYISNPPAGEHAKSKSTQPSVTLWIIAHVRPVLSLPHSLSVRRPSQNGSIGISGIFPQAKLMMMVVVERHRCSRFARARVHSRIGLKREIEERRGHRCLQSHFFRSPFFPRPPPAPPRSSIRRDQDCGKEGAPLVVRVSECQGMLRSALSSPALACLIKDDDERGITRYCLTLDL